MNALINKQMPQLSTLQSLLNFIAEVVPFLTIFGASWKLVDAGFKYFTDARKNAIKDIVQETVKPQIEQLTDSIDSLRESIGELKSKIK